MAGSGVLERVREATPQIAKHAQWAETHGRLHDDTALLLAELGIGRLYLPTSLGGYAVPPRECAEVCEALAAADASAAWYVMVYNAARLMAARWPQQSIEAVWADDPDCLVAASGNAALTGETCAGGFVISGRNSFVSGCHHARFMLAPLRHKGREEEMLSVLVPMDACNIVDNWDTSGMRGTGSNDVEVPDVVVPPEYVISQDEEPNRYYSDRLYSAPARVVFATYIPIALKLAEQALAELTALAGMKVPYATDQKLAHRPLAQQHYAQGLAHWHAARQYFFAALDTAWEQAGQGQKFSPAQRAELYLAGTHAMQQSAVAVQHVVDAAGSSSLHRGMPLERIYRDMQALRHHGFASESRYANVAQVLWGVPLDYPLLLR